MFIACDITHTHSYFNTSCSIYPYDYVDTSHGLTSPAHLEDRDGSISLADTVLQLLNQLVNYRNPKDLTEGEISTMDTLVYMVFDLYQHADIVLKKAIAKTFGDKYIRCLIDINTIVHQFPGKLKAIATQLLIAIKIIIAWH